MPSVGGTVIAVNMQKYLKQTERIPEHLILGLGKFSASDNDACNEVSRIFKLLEAP